jgi:hypothetical protein
VLLMGASPTIPIRPYIEGARHDRVVSPELRAAEAKHMEVRTTVLSRKALLISPT